VVRPLVTILLAVRGRTERDFRLRSTEANEIVATASYSLPRSGRGMSRVHVRLDPEHGHLAEPILRLLLGHAARLRPEVRTEMSITHWMKAVIDAAESVGMERRVDNRRMGLLL
jgi:hypothetical protein